MSGKPIDEAMRYQFETWARPKWRHREDFDQRIGAPHGTYNNFEVQAAWEAWQALTAAQQQGQAVAYPTGSDREVLQYLMQQFDAEQWYCPRCGHSEATADMDSADYLRRYLYAAPPSAPVGVESEPGAVRSLVAAANVALALYPGDDKLWTLESAVRPFNATKPAECADGCPPQQVCDYCQIASLAQQPAAVAPRAWLCTFGEVSGVTDDPKWRDMCARLGQQITPLVPAIAHQPATVDRTRFRKAPCYLCGYNGSGYFQPETHPCAARYHATHHQETT